MNLEEKNMFKRNWRKYKMSLEEVKKKERKMSIEEKRKKERV